MALYVRKLEEDEEKELERMIQSMGNDVSIQRLMIILLSSQGHKVQEISLEVDLHPINVRKWIHRFNTDGFAPRIFRCATASDRRCRLLRTQVIEFAFQTVVAATVAQLPDRRRGR